ncbi:hypothetical protein EVAR_100905_1 [Eumeta japonica]|uniref:Uncharacterized protein n=1 Tax=Eumeta variegata TaxID=151549 RepID=A0A4C1T827_EUMVA|nr:hypothetical protein EVAR_100905_1 [Eumeta japonica]
MLKVVIVVSLKLNRDVDNRAARRGAAQARGPAGLAGELSARGRRALWLLFASRHVTCAGVRGESLRRLLLAQFSFPLNTPAQFERAWLGGRLQGGGGSDPIQAFAHEVGLVARRSTTELRWWWMAKLATRRLTMRFARIQAYKLSFLHLRGLHVTVEQQGAPAPSMAHGADCKTTAVSILVKFIFARGAPVKFRTANSKHWNYFGTNL